MILSKAQIVSIKNEMLNNNDPVLAKYEKTLTIELTYEKIEWKWLLGNKTAQDTFL